MKGCPVEGNACRNFGLECLRHDVCSYVYEEALVTDGYCSEIKNRALESGEMDGISESLLNTQILQYIILTVDLNISHCDLRNYSQMDLGDSRLSVVVRI